MRNICVHPIRFGTGSSSLRRGAWGSYPVFASQPAVIGYIVTLAATVDQRRKRITSQ